MAEAIEGEVEGSWDGDSDPGGVGHRQRVVVVVVLISGHAIDLDSSLAVAAQRRYRCRALAI